MPTVFRWEHGGNQVYITGTFNGWSNRVPMHRSGNDFVYIAGLAKGKHAYKFIVDDEWRFAPDQPTVPDAAGNINNVIDLTSFRPDDDTAPPPGGLARKDSLPGVGYGHDVPDEDEYTKEPPLLPPQLRSIVLNSGSPDPWDPCQLPPPNHVTLNHLYCTAIKDGLMVQAVTQRYRRKHVTTVLYSLMPMAASAAAAAALTQQAVGALPQAVGGGGGGMPAQQQQGMQMPPQTQGGGYPQQQPQYGGGPPQGYQHQHSYQQHDYTQQPQYGQQQQYSTGPPLAAAVPSSSASPSLTALRLLTAGGPPLPGAGITNGPSASSAVSASSSAPSPTAAAAAQAPPPPMVFTLTLAPPAEAAAASSSRAAEAVANSSAVVNDGSVSTQPGAAGSADATAIVLTGGDSNNRSRLSSSSVSAAAESVAVRRRKNSSACGPIAEGSAGEGVSAEAASNSPSASSSAMTEDSPRACRAASTSSSSSNNVADSSSSSSRRRSSASLPQLSASSSAASCIHSASQGGGGVSRVNSSNAGIGSSSRVSIISLCGGSSSNSCNASFASGAQSEASGAAASECSAAASTVSAQSAASNVSVSGASRSDAGGISIANSESPAPDVVTPIIDSQPRSSAASPPPLDGGLDLYKWGISSDCGASSPNDAQSFSRELAPPLCTVCSSSINGITCPTAASGWGGGGGGLSGSVATIPLHSPLAASPAGSNGTLTSLLGSNSSSDDGAFLPQRQLQPLCQQCLDVWGNKNSIGGSANYSNGRSGSSNCGGGSSASAGQAAVAYAWQSSDGGSSAGYGQGELSGRLGGLSIDTTGPASPSGPSCLSLHRLTPAELGNGASQCYISDPGSASSSGASPTHALFSLGSSSKGNNDSCGGVLLTPLTGHGAPSKLAFSGKGSAVADADVLPGAGSDEQHSPIALVADGLTSIPAV